MNAAVNPTVNPITVNRVPNPARSQPLPPMSELSSSRTVGWWGMVLLIITEATIFVALISSYFFLHFNAAEWPLGDIARPELRIAIINTVLLVGSSFPMQMALRSIRRGSRSGLQIGIIIGFILGAIFLGLQAYEFSHSEFMPQTNAYGSLFFTILSIHGLHVLVGLGLAFFILVRTWFGHFDALHYQAVENSVLYWHFVDAVWIVIFVSLYLSPYLTL
jgi:heme/copper-type cytochrome/quinol oxidase subunit 3